MTGNGKLFVSHTHADNARCEPLLAALDAWNLDYWFDGQQLDAGQQLSPRLQEAILQRDVLLRVCTLNTANSYWMNLEMSAFRAAEHQQRSKDRKRLSVDLRLDEGYAPGILERADVTISAVNKPERAWLDELAVALGARQTLRQQQTISRRRALGLGGAALVTAAGLAGSGYLVKTRSDAAAAPYPRPKTIAFSNPQALDTRIKWLFKPGDGSPAALALTKDALIVNGSDGVFALNLEDGGIRWWRTDVTGSASNGLKVVGDVIYLCADGLSAHLYALHAADGSTIWNTATNSSVGDTGLALANGVIYMIDDNNHVVAYDAHKGALLWTSGQKIVLNGFADRAPIASGGVLYLGADDGRLLALSAANGAQLWSVQTGGAVGGAVTLSNGVVYVGSQDQNLYAVDAASGSVRWRYATSAQETYAPAVGGGVVYICPFDTIMAVDAATGALKWQAKLDGANFAAQSSGPLELSGDTIYVSASEYLYAFSAQKQAPLWKLTTATSNLNTTTPALSGTTAYWSTDDGFVYALDNSASA